MITTFWSCHLRKLPDDRRHVRDLIDADFFIGEVFLLYFWNGFQNKREHFFSLLSSFGEALNISTANDFTCTVFHKNFYIFAARDLICLVL